MKEAEIKALMWTSYVVWAYVLFYFFGFGNILFIAIQRTQSAMGAFFIAALGISVFFIPVIAFNSVVKSILGYKPEKKEPEKKS